MKLTENHVERIKQAIEQVSYGKVTIMIDGTRGVTDIISEKRERISTEHLKSYKKKNTL
jgi:hypothetical protein